MANSPDIESAEKKCCFNTDGFGQPTVHIVNPPPLLLPELIVLNVLKEIPT